MTLSFETDKDTSDIKEVTFGIQQVTTELKRISNDYGRVFRINGERIFCKGGWLQLYMLLNTNRKRIFDETRLLAEANINIVSNEDDPSPSDDLIESFDKYGLIYWEIFFQCYRMYPGRETAHNPLDHQLATNMVKGIVQRLLNSPRVVAWFDTNEVIGDEDLYNLTRKTLKALDVTRPFIPTTSISWDVDKLTPYIKEDLPTGTTDDGAPGYNWHPQFYYFDKVEEVHFHMFHNELGVPAIPVFSSLSKFIPTAIVHGKQSLRNPIYPLESIWAEHGAWDVHNYCFRAYDNAIRTLYGNPTTAQEYANEAQYVNADSYRAMFEAANHRMWNITSGVMLWKLNSCWPDVSWQIYDWFLNPNAAYYFTEKAAEHIQMNANSRKLSIINATHAALHQLRIEAKIIDFDMKEIWSFADTVSVGADCYKECVTIPKQVSGTPIYFVKLIFKDEKDSLLSDNLYWQCSQNEDFSALTALPKVKLTKTIISTDQGKKVKWTINLKNETNQLSFFNLLWLCNEATHEEVLPSFWSDNFVTLFPGEEKTLTVIVAKEDLHGVQPVIEIE